MPPIAKFIQTYPGVTLNARAMASLDLLPLLRAGDLDVAFVTACDAIDDLFCRKVASFRVGIVARRDGPLAGVERLTWKEVANLRLIQREPNAGTRQIFESAAARSGIVPDTVLGLGSWGSITSLVRAGVGEGVGFESELMVTDKDLMFIPIDDKNLGAHQFLVALPAMAGSSAVSNFYEITQKTLDGMDG
jgi:DNA-binding transcriptional LysR family regulator